MEAREPLVLQKSELKQGNDFESLRSVADVVRGSTPHAKVYQLEGGPWDNIFLYAEPPLGLQGGRATILGSALLDDKLRTAKVPDARRESLLEIARKTDDINISAGTVVGIVRS